MVSFQHVSPCVTMYIARALLYEKYNWINVADLFKLFANVSYITLYCLANKTFVTHAAFIWSLPSMCPFMFYKIIISCESLITLAALIWSLPSVCHYKFCKVRIFYEGLDTKVALAWFIPSGCQHMIFKRAIPCRSLVTLAALVWFLPSMCHESRGVITWTTIPDMNDNTWWLWLTEWHTLPRFYFCLRQSLVV